MYTSKAVRKIRSERPETKVGGGQASASIRFFLCCGQNSWRLPVRARHFTDPFQFGLVHFSVVAGYEPVTVVAERYSPATCVAGRAAFTPCQRRVAAGALDR